MALDFSQDVFAETVRVNLIGVSNSIAAVLPGMRKHRRGHLAALSSLASYRGMPRMAADCASKAGVNALMDALRVELRTARDRLHDGLSGLGPHADDGDGEPVAGCEC